MRYTHEDNLTRLWGPAVRAMRPTRELLHERASAHAISDDGYIRPPALLPGTGVVVDFDSSAATASSSDIVNPAEYIGYTFTLPPGLWYLKARAAITGSLNGASNLNAYVYLNGEASSNYQIPLGAGDVATVFPRMFLPEVSGEVTLQVMFRPSAGTATVEAGEWLYRAERIR